MRFCKLFKTNKFWVLWSPLDIKKGGGSFDDFDGYSFYQGSASTQQYQDSDEVVSGWFKKLLAGLAGGKVDEDLNTSIHVLGDEYINAPGQQWYRNCSLSI